MFPDYGINIPNYSVAPEVARLQLGGVRQGLDELCYEKVDVFSLGFVLYVLLTQTSPCVQAHARRVTSRGAGG